MDQRTLFFILTRPGTDQLLLQRTGNKWCLPTYDQPVGEDVGFADPSPFNNWFAHQYGIAVVRHYPADLQGTDAAYFVLAPCGEAPSLPPDTLWISPAELGHLTIAPPTHRALLTSWVADQRPSATMPFAGPGGYAAPLAWMGAVLAQRGLALLGEPEQVKNAYVSTVFRCPTSAGRVYLKIIPPVFMREVAITRRLGEWGIALPEVLALDEERGLLLTREMGGSDLSACCTVDNLEAAVRAYARLQLAAVDRITHQDPWPFYDWRAGSIATQLEGLAAQVRLQLQDSPYTLTEAEEVQLERCLPAWAARVSQLQQGVLPYTLDHGDLRLGNTRLVEGEFIFYDWAWSALAHPFIGLPGLLHSVRRLLPDPVPDRARLRDAYLEVWTGQAPAEELRPSFDLAARLLPLYGVVGDLAWLQAIRRHLGETVPSALSADAWTLRWRQYYFAVVVRRLL